MPLKKGLNRKNPTDSNKNKAKIPTKREAYQKRNVDVEITQKSINKRVTSLATAGKKKRPK